MGNEAVAVAKERVDKEKDGGIRTLSTGVRARFHPVSATLIQSVAGRIEDPKVPVWINPDKDREEPNPNDPDYVKAVDRANVQRGLAAIDAMVMFGVELVDGVPEGDGWLKKIRLMEKLGHLDLSDFDLDDELDREFLYKRWFAVGQDDLVEVTKLSGVPTEEVARAARTFPE